LVSTPIPGLNGMRLHISGLEEGNSLYTQRLARTLGAQVAIVFSKKSTTHLICTSVSGVKYEHAVQWGIPTLRPEWLYDMARTGAVPEATPYNVSADPPAPAIVDVTNQVPLVSGPAPPIPVLPSPPQENIQPPGLISPQTLPASSSDSRLRVSQRISPSRQRSSNSPNKSSGNSSAVDALSHLAAVLGEKRKSSESDVEEKAQPSKRRTRPVTRIKSGDISGPSTSSGRPTFVPLQAFNFAEASPRASDDMDTSKDGPFGAPLDESMRVTYEDPESRAEKRKLMKLIGVLPESMEPLAASESLLETPPTGTRQPRPRPLNKRSTRQS